MAQADFDSAFKFLPGIASTWEEPVAFTELASGASGQLAARVAQIRCLAPS